MNPKIIKAICIALFAAALSLFVLDDVVAELLTDEEGARRAYELANSSAPIDCGKYPQSGPGIITADEHALLLKKQGEWEKCAVNYYKHARDIVANAASPVIAVPPVNRRLWELVSVVVALVLFVAFVILAVRVVAKNQERENPAEKPVSRPRAACAFSTPIPQPPQHSTYGWAKFIWWWGLAGLLFLMGKYAILFLEYFLDGISDCFLHGRFDIDRSGCLLTVEDSRLWKEPADTLFRIGLWWAMFRALKFYCAIPAKCKNVRAFCHDNCRKADRTLLEWIKMFPAMMVVFFKEPDIPSLKR